MKKDIYKEKYKVVFRRYTLYIHKLQLVDGMKRENIMTDIFFR